MPINLGDKVKDSVTGIEGIVTSRTEYLHGCARVGVQPAKLHEGRPVDAYMIDEPQCVLVKANAVKVGPVPRLTGGPHDHVVPARR